MTPTRKRAVNIVALLTAIGTALAVAKPALAMLTSTLVMRADYDRDQIARLTWEQSMVIRLEGVTIKLDSANLRLRQIQCGKRIQEGCR